jgi:hypothetical protein
LQISTLPCKHQSESFKNQPHIPITSITSCHTNITSSNNDFTPVYNDITPAYNDIKTAINDITSYNTDTPFYDIAFDNIRSTDETDTSFECPG